ncbi:MAG: hypothetical protein IPH71_10130 [Proteobacteria bacterium]|jgi:hypothetical protein|nr:hypothetical protein [Pseudomonadota bacterium]MBK7116365.1 hypothetical protein [Pseudomonadota bacterium]MCC6631982.1 hypothetical protein [Gammaproteobacteria bacterium]
MLRSRLTLSIVVAMLGAPLALAHHSLSGQFDTTKSFQITGVVSKVDWINPHTQVFVDVKQANGTTITYKLESLPVAMMRKSGLSKSDLVGDGRPVVIDAYPARGDTPHLGYLLHIRLPDGRDIQFSKVPGAEQP